MEKWCLGHSPDYPTRWEMADLMAEKEKANQKLQLKKSSQDCKWGAEEL